MMIMMMLMMLDLVYRENVVQMHSPSVSPDTIVIHPSTYPLLLYHLSMCCEVRLCKIK